MWLHMRIPSFVFNGEKWFLPAEAIFKQSCYQREYFLIHSAIWKAALSYLLSHPIKECTAMANIPNISLPCVSWKSPFVRFDKHQSSRIFFWPRWSLRRCGTGNCIVGKGPRCCCHRSPRTPKPLLSLILHLSVGLFLIHTTPPVPCLCPVLTFLSLTHLVTSI